MRDETMPPDHADLTTRRILLLWIALTGGFFKDGELAKLLIANGGFVLVTLLCFFGSIVPLVRLKARQEEGWLARIYSAFYGFVVTVALAAGAYYGLHCNVFILIIAGPIVGAIMEGILDKFFVQVESPPDFSALLSSVLSMLQLLGRIISAVWDVIAASKGKGGNNDLNNNSTQT